MRRSCAHPGCLNKAIGKHCPKHGWRQKNYGTTRLPDKKTKDPIRDIWDKVDKGDPDECWPWTGTRIPQGYGIVTWEGRPQTAHRVVYTLAQGEIPEGLQLDHLCHTAACTAGNNCRHRRCCNPNHLKPVTRKENNAPDRAYRRRGRRTTHCPHGHEYTEENTRLTSEGWRNCRTCERARKR